MSQAPDLQPTLPLSGQAARGPVALVYSPMAGVWQGEQAREILEHAGIPVALSQHVATLRTDEPQGERWRAAGCVAAVAAGGDGTLGAVATQVASVGLPLGILPMGTANDVARSLEIPLDLHAAARVIAAGWITAIDAGQAVRLAPSPTAAQLGGGYFLHALTLGLNVEFARLATDVTQRQHWGRLTYAVSAFESLEHFRPIAVTLRFSGIDGAQDRSAVVQSEVVLLAAINLPAFGGRLGLRVPGVRSDDRLLDVITVEASTAPTVREAIEAALHALNSVTRGRQGQVINVQPPESGSMALAGARWFRAEAVTIETEGATDLTLDGELRGQTPALVRVAPEKVWMFVPAKPQTRRRATRERVSIENENT